MDAEEVTPTPVRAVGRTVFTQTWADLTLLHWEVEPQRVQRHLPVGVRPDTFEGRTFVGLVPFRMRGIGAWGSPSLPYLGSFLETNVRLYSVEHERWSLYRARAVQIDDELLAVAGFGDLARRTPDSVLFSPGVHARFGPRLAAAHQTDYQADGR